MKITPQEITNQEFSTKMRGFDKDEVKDFLLQVSEAIEGEILEKEDLKKELERQKGSLAKLKKKEELLRETLISAQKFSHDIKHSAERESDIIIKEAEIKADEILNDAMTRQKTLREEIKHLQYKRKEIESDLINTLNSLKELIESYQKEDEAFDKVEYLKKS
jgi:cell division initiation protein